MSWSLLKEKERVEIRKVYADTLKILLESNENIVLLDADLASSAGTGDLFEKYPERCVNVGISEQNMVGVGAGMSQIGLIPYAHTFAPFASRRVLDQIYMSLAYSNSSLHIYASDPGYWSEYNGGTHTSFEDISILKAIPNINIVAPSDPVTFKWVLQYYAEHKGVFYNRTTRKFLDCIYSLDSEFQYGKGQLIRKGEDVALIAIGAMVSNALEAAEILEKEGISATVVDLFFVKPYDRELIREVIHSHPLIVTAENHSRIGGIGEIVASEMARSGSNSILKQVAVDDRFGEVGGVDYLKEVLHLTTRDILEVVTNHFLE